MLGAPFEPQAVLIPSPVRNPRYGGALGAGPSGPPLLNDPDLGTDGQPLPNRQVREEVTVRRVTPTMLVRRMGREQLIPRGATLMVIGRRESISVFGTPTAVAAVKAGIRVGDPVIEPCDDGTARATVTLERAAAEALRPRLLQLADAGSVEVRGRDLVLDGRRPWIRQAVGIAMRAGIGLAEPLAEPANLAQFLPMEGSENELGRRVRIEALPVADPADGSPREEAFQKFFLQRADADQLHHRLLVQERALPAGVIGILAFPRDQSLLVRGLPAAIAALERAARVGDARIEDLPAGRARVVLSPQHVKPELLRERALRLPGAGTATVQRRSLELEGSRPWLQRAIGAAMRAEMAAPSLAWRQWARPAPIGTALRAKMAAL
jgi:hypothetical protein